MMMVVIIGMRMMATAIKVVIVIMIPLLARVKKCIELSIF